MGEAEHTAARWLVRALAVLRVGQLLPWAASVPGARWQGYALPQLVVVLYGVEAVWAVVLFGRALKKDYFPRWMICADVSLAAFCAFAVGHSCLPGYATTWSNWTPPVSTGAAVLTAAMWGLRAGLVAVAAQVVPYVAAARADLPVAGSAISTAIGNVAFMIIFTISAWFVASWLVGSAVQVDRSNARASAAERAVLIAERLEAETRAAFNERTRQYRLLHDNVLSTLTAIARGGLDHRSARVRKQCGREADFLRGLISAATDAAPTDLAASLAIASRSILDLTVHQQNNLLPASLPLEVVEAISQATREALNNVTKHSGTKEAWLTATAKEGSSIVVTVVDRGCGFGPSAHTSGLGIPHSIRERVAEVGGLVVIDSVPGEGTSVEIEWKP